MHRISDSAVLFHQIINTMKRFILPLVVLFIGLTSSISAQVLDPISETPLDSDAKQIFLNSATGIPVLQTASEYIGLSPKDGSIMWKATRNAGASLTEMASGGGETRDFEEIPGTPYVFASGNLINILDGTTIIDGADRDLRILRTYYTMPEQDMILLEIGGKGAVYLYAFNPFESKLLWDVQLREVSGLSQLASEGAADPDLKPRLNAAGNLIYTNGKFLALIDTKSGELKWNEKIPAGYIFTNEKGDRMVIAEKRGGLGGAMAASMAALPTGGLKERKFSKKLHLIDTETGKSIWKKEEKMDGNVLYVAPYDGGFMVVHDEGMNIYSFDDSKPEGRWKKDYKEKGVLNVETGDEGLMVYFKNKRMLVDPISGDEKWKKAEKLEKEPKGFMWGLASAYEPKTEEVGSYNVTFDGDSFTAKKDGAISRSYDYDMIIVEDDRIAVIDYMYDAEGKPDGVSLSVTHLDGDKVERKTRRIKLKRGIQGFDKTSGGYFVYNDRGFRLYQYDRNAGFEEIKREYYPDPTAAKRFLIGMATAIGSTAYAVGSTANMVTSGAQGNLGPANSFNDRMYALNKASNAGFDLSERKINGQIDDDFAFFFARDGKEGATLFKVAKDSGEEIAKYRFDDLTPLYEIDYQNSRLYYQAKKTFKIFELE